MTTIDGDKVLDIEAEARIGVAEAGGQLVHVRCIVARRLKA